jgi:hypothetical protein
VPDTTPVTSTSTMVTVRATAADAPGTSHTATCSPGITVVGAVTAPGSTKRVESVTAMARGVEHPGTSRLKPLADGAGDPATVPLSERPSDRGPCGSVSRPENRRGVPGRRRYPPSRRPRPPSAGTPPVSCRLLAPSSSWLPGSTCAPPRGSERPRGSTGRHAPENGTRCPGRRGLWCCVCRPCLWAAIVVTAVCAERVRLTTPAGRVDVLSAVVHTLVRPPNFGYLQRVLA